MAGPATPAPTCGLLVPVKDFRRAKLRLAPVLDPTGRAALARSMAQAVLDAAGPLATWVVCDDDDVATWATQAGAAVLWSPGKGLNGAVTDGVAAVAAAGVDRVVVAHADLPLARDFTHLTTTPGVALVPDERHDGTNVLSLPTGTGFRFAYGAGSFRRHEGEARRLGLAVSVVDDAELGFDVDDPAHLRRLLAIDPGRVPVAARPAS